MFVLIMGGSGLIGRAFASEMLAAGHRVMVLTRRPEQVSLPECVEVCGWDGRTPLSLVEQVEQADAVVNLIGENIGGGLWTAERKRRILESRLQAGQLLVEAVRRAKKRPSIILQASAVGYYGNLTEPVTETSPAGSDYMADVVVRWEASSQPLESLGLRRIILRSGVVLHPREGILPRFLLPIRLFAGGPMGSGRQGVSWIHIQDEVRAMRFLLEDSTAQGVYNLSAPTPVSNAEFCRAVARTIGRPYWIPAPAFALRLLLGEMSALVLDGQYVLPTRLSAAGFQFLHPQLNGALKDLLG
jgi:uncharacterized protein (TIGR01777 family)